MENVLYKWFLKQRERNEIVNKALIMQRARELHSKFTPDKNFNASEGWFSNFKRRYGIRFLQISGEKLSSPVELIDPFKIKLKETMEKMEISLDQLYNADESALFWKLLPNKTYVAVNEKSAPGRKTDKSRVTFLACTNASGTHKIPPLVIGKSKSPRCFARKIPDFYASSKNAWMTSFIFKEWFHKTFVPEVQSFNEKNGTFPKALLILDNAPCHPSELELVSSDGKICVLYMPPNVTPIIQPMDQNVIRLTKLHYRSLLLSSIVAEDNVPISEILKKITLKDAIINLIAAWDRVSEDVIKKCWGKILDFSSIMSNNDSIESASSVNNSWETVDTSLDERDDPEVEHCLRRAVVLLKRIGGDNQTNDVLNWNEDRTGSDDDNFSSSEEEDDDLSEETVVPSKEVLPALNTIIKWAGQRNVDYKDIANLQKLREFAVKESVDNLRQTNISDFFKTN